MKKLEIEKPKPICIMSVLKVEYVLGGCSFIDFQIFTNKTSVAKKWMSFDCSDLALEKRGKYFIKHFLWVMQKGCEIHFKTVAYLLLFFFYFFDWLCGMKFEL